MWLLSCLGLRLSSLRVVPKTRSLALRCPAPTLPSPRVSLVVWLGLLYTISRKVAIVPLTWLVVPTWGVTVQSIPLVAIGPFVRFILLSNVLRFGWLAPRSRCRFVPIRAWPLLASGTMLVIAFIVVRLL